MECDSMHSAIEFAQKNSSVFCVSAWKIIFEVARRKNPYAMHQLGYSDFVDCKALCDRMIKNRSKNEEGETVNWLRIKVLRFEKDSRCIQYKYRYGDKFSSINVCGRGRPAATSLPELSDCYRSGLPISMAKKNDLLTLCKSDVILTEHHYFFKNLPSSKKDADCEDSD